MARKQHDVVFVGGGLASLTAATALAKTGKSVLFLDSVQPPNPDNPDPSFDFSFGPRLYFGFENGGAMEGFFSGIAFPIPSLKQRGFRYEKMDPLLQVVLPSHRVNLYQKEADYLEELAREYPGEQNKMSALFKEVASHAAHYYPFLGRFSQIESPGIGERLESWKKRREFDQAVQAQRKLKATEFVDQYKFSADMLAHFDLLSLFAFNLPFSEISAFDWVRLFSAFQKGGCQILGGSPFLVHFFSGLIKNRGGKVVHGEAVTHVETKNKGIEGLTLSEGSFYAARNFVIYNPPEKPRMDFFFTIPGNLIPVPMKNTLLMTWGVHPPAGLENILVLHLNLEKEDEPHSSDFRKIVVSCLPSPGESFSQEDRKILEEKVLKKLYWIIPFSESKLQPVSPNRPFGKEWDNFFKFIGGSIDKSSKRKSKGILNYLKPKPYKNVLILPSDQSSMIEWGTSFLEGMELASLLEKSL